MTNEELWKAVLAEMELALSKANFTTWFRGTSLVSNNMGSVLVSVPNGFIKEWLENKFNKQIYAIIRKYQTDVREIRYVIGSARPEATLARRDFVQLVPENPMKEAENEDVNKTTNLNKRYTFDSFIVGPNN